MRTIRIDGNVAFVPLTQGYEAIVDADDVPIVEGVKWRALVVRRKDGSIRAVYACRAVYEAGRKQRVVHMHRLVSRVPDGMLTDHIDGNGLNNRKINLRWASYSQNQHNSKARRSSTSGVKGVSWVARDRKWRAAITINYRKMFLGDYNDIASAADAYKKASAIFHGEFGRTA